MGWSPGWRGRPSGASPPPYEPGSLWTSAVAAGGGVGALLSKSLGNGGGDALLSRSLGRGVGGSAVGGGLVGMMSARRGRPFRSESLGAASDYNARAGAGGDDMDAIRRLGDMLRSADIGVGPPGFAEAGGDCGGSDFSPDSYGDEYTSFVMDEDMGLDDGRGRGASFSSPVPVKRAAHVVFEPLDGEGEMEGPGEAEVTPPGFTPLKPDSLIPLDLLGALDDPATPALVRAFTSSPPLDEKNGYSDDSKARKGGKGKKKKEKARDLAAALFRPSRSRSNSMPCHKSPMVKSAAVAPPPEQLLPLTPHLLPLPPGAVPTAARVRALSGAGIGVSADVGVGVSVTGMADLFQKQLDSATQILLSMNATLGEEAATEAALVSDCDINVAQYVVDGAMSAPPICRHALHDGCYRSDCQFSHDIDGHTCLFWLRGRCGKGSDGCRFMHGFSSKHLEGIKSDFLPVSRGGGLCPMMTSTHPQTSVVSVRPTYCITT